jgi:uncharacterized protein
MFKRKIIQELEKWREKKGRKPLVLRGARQVGKTTLVNQFGQQFGQYIYLNLELAADKKPFEEFTNLQTLIESLFFLKNKSLAQKKETLVFIDEIQEVPAALNILRYFFEEEPNIAVIAAGSMLESLFDKDISFPVGRVEYKVVRPVSFPEFLGALDETAALEQLQKIPNDNFSHEKLMQLFHTYALIGGMPEIVRHYAENKDLAALGSIYDSLINAYLDDVEKYATSNAQILHIRHVIRSSFLFAGKRIKFEGFGNSSYKSREMGEALRILEKALLLQLVYPNIAAQLPLQPDIKKSPRLQILDTGMLNYFVGIQKEILGTKNLNEIYQGTMIEHLVGQELLATNFEALTSLHFWVREKKTSMAEMDFVFVHASQLMPIEVKSGETGHLKSLHQFMDLSPQNLAIRFYAGERSLTTVETPAGKKFQLLNLPYYLVSQIEHYLDWSKKQTA